MWDIVQNHVRMKHDAKRCAATAGTRIMVRANRLQAMKENVMRKRITHGNAMKKSVTTLVPRSANATRVTVNAPLVTVDESPMTKSAILAIAKESRVTVTGKVHVRSNRAISKLTL